MKVIARTVVKPVNDIYQNNVHRKNEDAYKIFSNRIAVSDGAGGIGILADCWAKLLVKKIPKQPFDGIEGLDRWIAKFWEEFYNHNRQKLKDDIWKLKKFDSEGSLATLSVLWEIRPGNFIYQSYGDSVMFVFDEDKGTLQIQKNMTELNSFSLNPDLLNWKTEKHKKDKFYSQTICLKENESIIIATDGIGMYIYGAYIAYKNNFNNLNIPNNKIGNIIKYYQNNKIDNFSKWMNSIRKNLKNNKIFKDFTNNLYHNCYLPNDDYTLAWISR